MFRDTGLGVQVSRVAEVEHFRDVGLSAQGQGGPVEVCVGFGMPFRVLIWDLGAGQDLPTSRNSVVSVKTPENL